jgi:putative oxidoreductase
VIGMARSPIERHLAPYSETIYALFRLVFGLLFWFHGAQKLFGWFGGSGAEHLNTLMLIAGLIEFIAGALIAIGLYAGPAAFLASGQMAVAYFMVHHPRGLLPIDNKGELAVLYCFAFLLIAARGSGKLSVDASRR